MKKIILTFIFTAFGVPVFAAPTNSELIEREILGQIFCYTDDGGAGWIFSKDGQAVQHAVNFGMPGPSSHYRLTFIDSPRTVGHFELVGDHETYHFNYRPERLLYEYETGRALSVKACGKRFQKRGQ